MEAFDDPPESGTFTYNDNTITFNYSDDPGTQFAISYALESTTLILDYGWVFGFAYIRQ